MKLFRKKTTNDPVVPQLEQYYDDQRGWKLWVRRIIGILIVLVIVFAIGWAAWAVYNRVTDDGLDDGSIDSQTSQDGTQTPSDTTTKKEGSDSENSTDETANDSQAAAPATGNDDDSSSTGTATDSAKDQSASAATDSTAGKGEPAQTIPKTGPADTAALVIGASVIGAVAHRLLLSRRTLTRS